MDNNAKEVMTKVQALVKTHFNGDYMAAFAHYDLDHSNKLGPKDLYGLLADAGIGNLFTRKTWVSGLIAELDKDRDGAVSIPELTVAMMEGFVFP